MTTENTEKHLARTTTEEFYLEDDVGKAYEALKSGGGWVLVKAACNPDPDCQEVWDGYFESRGKYGALEFDSIIGCIHKSTILNKVTKDLILFGGPVLLYPQPPMVYFPKPEDNNVALYRIKGAPQYTPEIRLLVIMKTQFGGSPGTKYCVFLEDSSQKLGSPSGPKRHVDAVAGDELLYNGALRISYPICITCDRDRANTCSSMYGVGGEYLSATSELPKLWRDKLIQEGELETKEVLANKYPNILWY